MTLPSVICLCPTYRRPRLLENALACFERQDYPRNRSFLLICDDSGELKEQGCFKTDNWSLIVEQQRFPSLSEKYNYMASLFESDDLFFVWEDDDVYLPNHISSHVEAFIKSKALGKPAYCKPPYVWTTHPKPFTKGPWVEPADGRFHASLSFTREMFQACGGWPITKAPNFDQQFMAKLAATGPLVVPEPQWSYVFRWADTGAYHGQAFGENWYDMIPSVTGPQRVDYISPKFDDSTVEIFRSILGVEP